LSVIDFISFSIDIHELFILLIFLPTYLYIYPIGKGWNLGMNVKSKIDLDYNFNV